MLEFLEDRIAEDPTQAFPQGADNLQFQTGDALIDLWERAGAKGEVVDYHADIDPEFLKRLQRFQSVKKEFGIEAAMHGGFRDTYKEEDE